MNAIYLETDVGSAIFPGSDGLFDELTAGQMYKLHGDPIGSLSAAAPASEIRNVVLGFASEWTTSISSVAIASTPARATSWTYTSTPAPGTSWTPAVPYSAESSRSSWSAFRSVAPSSRKQRIATSRYIRKNVDLCLLEVVNNKLQLGEARSATFIRIAESDICLSSMTDLVQMRFEEFIPPDDRIILVDSRAVPFQDDDGTRGIDILTDIDRTHDRVCMYIYCIPYVDIRTRTCTITCRHTRAYVYGTKYL